MPKITVGDIELYYEVSGEGEPLILLHGLGSSARDWEMQVDFFAQSYQVIACDARGHGQSDKPPGPYSIPLFAQDIATLIKQLNLAPVHLVGISMGGMIGFQLAVDAPDLLKSLVIVNSGPEVIPQTFKDRLQILQRRLIVRLLGMQKMGEVLAGRLFPKPEQAELREIFIARWAENDRRAYRDSLEAIIGWSVSDKLGQITCPTLIIAADHDYTPVETKEAYLPQISNAKMIIIKDSRHATPIDQPEKFNQAVADFLKNQSS